LINLVNDASFKASQVETLKKENSDMDTKLQVMKSSFWMKIQFVVILFLFIGVLFAVTNPQINDSIKLKDNDQFNQFKEVLLWNIDGKSESKGVSLKDLQIKAL
jgi:hypothetical protein